MAYADQKLSGNRLAAIIIVALIHIAVGYALITGLAYEAATKIIKKVTTVDIKEDQPKPPPPPPPPPDPRCRRRRRSWRRRRLMWRRLPPP
jgi:protein TonB